MSQVTHRTEQEITDGLAEVLKSPQDHGLLKAVVIRPGHEERRTLQTCRLSPDGGTEGDADHNVDGKLTRKEMELFENQQPHRDVEQLLRNFDTADTSHDGVVSQEEIDAYGTEIGSKDPKNRPN